MADGCVISAISDNFNTNQYTNICSSYYSSGSVLLFRSGGTFVVDLNNIYSMPWCCVVEVFRLHSPSAKKIRISQ